METVQVGRKNGAPRGVMAWQGVTLGALAVVVATAQWGPRVGPIVALALLPMALALSAIVLCAATPRRWWVAGGSWAQWLLPAAWMLVLHGLNCLLFGQPQALPASAQAAGFADLGALPLAGLQAAVLLLPGGVALSAWQVAAWRRRGRQDTL